MAPQDQLSAVDRVRAMIADFKKSIEASESNLDSPEPTVSSRKIGGSILSNHCRASSRRNRPGRDRYEGFDSSLFQLILRRRSYNPVRMSMQNPEPVGMWPCLPSPIGSVYLYPVANSQRRLSRRKRYVACPSSAVPWKQD